MVAVGSTRSYVEIVNGLVSVNLCYKINISIGIYLSNKSQRLFCPETLYIASNYRK